MIPVTSTRVATKGADDVAGSKPRRFRQNGRSAPHKDPQSTTPTSERPTVSPTVAVHRPVLKVADEDTIPSS